LVIAFSSCPAIAGVATIAVIITALTQYLRIPVTPVRSGAATTKSSHCLDNVTMPQ
jgi:hypothetical protein